MTSKLNKTYKPDFKWPIGWHNDSNTGHFWFSNLQERWRTDVSYSVLCTCANFVFWDTLRLEHILILPWYFVRWYHGLPLSPSYCLNAFFLWTFARQPARLGGLGAAGALEQGFIFVKEHHLLTNPVHTCFISWRRESHFSEASLKVA